MQLADCYYLGIKILVPQLARGHFGHLRILTARRQSARTSCPRSSPFWTPKRAWRALGLACWGSWPAWRRWAETSNRHILASSSLTRSSGFPNTTRTHQEHGIAGNGGGGLKVATSSGSISSSGSLTLSAPSPASSGPGGPNVLTVISARD